MKWLCSPALTHLHRLTYRSLTCADCARLDHYLEQHKLARPDLATAHLGWLLTSAISFAPAPAAA
jgi:hypothetical protein